MRSCRKTTHSTVLHWVVLSRDQRSKKQGCSNNQLYQFETDYNAFQVGKQVKHFSAKDPPASYHVCDNTIVYTIAWSKSFAFSNYEKHIGTMLEYNTWWHSRWIAQLLAQYCELLLALWHSRNWNPQGYHMRKIVEFHWLLRSTFLHKVLACHSRTHIGPTKLRLLKRESKNIQVIEVNLPILH